MAIYHYSTQVASRSAGKSVVAMAAYRSGDRLEDERTGELKFYRRSTPPETIILAPANAPEWVQDRNRLWNEVEKAEKRKDAQLCREINVALPRELSADDQRELLLNYCQEQFADRGMVADVAIHRDNLENPHAHIMLTMRHIGPDGFGQKNREWNPSFAFGKVQNAEKYIDWRAAWADHANRALERAGETDRIDHRSFADQGIDRQPTIHEGPTVRQMEERGIQTDRGDLNRLAEEHNLTVVYLNKYRREKEALQQKMQKPPKERQLVRQAEQILGGPVQMDKLPAGFDRLKAQEAQLLQQKAKLDESMRPFEIADNYYRSLEAWEPHLKSSSGFSRLFNKQQREDHRLLSQRVQETREKLEKLGFKPGDREQFESRRAKVTSYNQQQLTGIQEQQHRITVARDVLKQTEKALQQVEVQRTQDDYPTWAGAKHLHYSEAKQINEVNHLAGRVLQPDEMASLSQKASASPSHDPVLKVLDNALKSFDEASRRAEQHEQQKEWSRRKERKDRGR